MKEALEQFRTQLGAAIDSMEFVKVRSTEKYTKLTAGKAHPDAVAMHESRLGPNVRSTSASGRRSGHVLLVRSSSRV
jgi:hypothetical protein